MQFYLQKQTIYFAQKNLVPPNKNKQIYGKWITRQRT